MSDSLTTQDREFLRQFTACKCAPSDFHHRAHVRLAYILLVDHDVEEAIERMRQLLLAFLQHHGIDAAKYHVTLTRAWMEAVAHFMHRSAPCPGSDAFIAANPCLLDSSIMLTHYSREQLFSAAARTTYVAPDLDPIPSYHVHSTERPPNA